MTTKRPRTPPKRRTKTSAQNPERNPDQPIPEIARVYAANIVKRLWPSLYEKAFGHAASL
jgi:hypothetical protein